jgi:hypothetical protein
MKLLMQYNQEDLKLMVYDLLTKTKIELGFNTDGKTLASLSNILAGDLIKEKRFGRLTFNQIVDAFHIGVRFGTESPFMSIRVFYKWIYEHKKKIDDATYQVRTLNKPPETVQFYQEKIKLLK